MPQPRPNIKHRAKSFHIRARLYNGLMTECRELGFCTASIRSVYVFVCVCLWVCVSVCVCMCVCVSAEANTLARVVVLNLVLLAVGSL